MVGEVAWTGCKDIAVAAQHPCIFGRLLWGVVECCGVLWSVVECCGVLWSVVECCGVLWSVVECCVHLLSPLSRLD